MQSSKKESPSKLPGRYHGNHQDGKAPRTHCVRCGTCCAKGGPTLHLKDMELLGNGIIKRSDIYTVRKGEAVFNNIEKKPSVLSEEIVKIKGAGEHYSCIFYDHIKKACTIYEDRPHECRAMKCWDTRDIETIFEKNRLRREHLIPPGNLLAETIASHEQRCSYLTLETLVKKLGGPKAAEAVEELLEHLRFDYYLRPLIAEKFKLPIEEMDFFFGRPLTTTITMFGLHVKQEGETFLLTPIEGDVR